MPVLYTGEDRRRVVPSGVPNGVMVINLEYLPLTDNAL